MVGPGPAQLKKEKEKERQLGHQTTQLTRLDMLQLDLDGWAGSSLAPLKKVSWAINLHNQIDSGWTRFRPAQVVGLGPA